MGRRRESVGKRESVCELGRVDEPIAAMAFVCDRKTECWRGKHVLKVLDLLFSEYVFSCMPAGAHASKPCAEHE